MKGRAKVKREKGMTKYWIEWEVVRENVYVERVE